MMQLIELNAIDSITERIANDAQFRSVAHDTVEAIVRDTWVELRGRARFTTFLPIFTERDARERLRARSEEPGHALSAQATTTALPPKAALWPNVQPVINLR
jgi:hypothetical protein